MNQQLVNENRFLKDEINNAKANALKLIEENTNLHNELKNVTIHEILNELHNDKNALVGDSVIKKSSSPFLDTYEVLVLLLKGIKT